MIILQFFVNSADATKVNLSQTFEPISWTHLLGTDDYGRDYLQGSLLVHDQHYSSQS